MGPRGSFKFGEHQVNPGRMVCLLLGCLILAPVACSDSHESRTHLEWKVLPERNLATEAAEQPKLPDCPDGDLKKLLHGSPSTGDHKVILSWNASTSALNAKKGEIGYCLYRREKYPVEKRKEHKGSNVKVELPCEKCEQVNVSPILETGCVDDVVKNDTTYYYVAITINRSQRSTDFSNQAPAAIPGSKVAAKSMSTSYRGCRDDDSPKAASHASSESRTH